jgi:tRNA 5-methylaminomethyl-2-thiouridine biosynthesis bifunctional protein
LWHARAGWVRPARLVEAWLAQPGIRLETGRRVSRIERIGGLAAPWALRDAQGRLLAEADRVVIAGGFESHALAPQLVLQAVRGQVEWGRVPEGACRLPPVPLNGEGHLIAHVPDPEGVLWLTGATFDRDHSEAAPCAQDTRLNRERLARLHPPAASELEVCFAHGRAQSWAGVRCASGDRRPLVGPLRPEEPDGIWLLTALGSRGLSFAALCAELLAARWHAEPLPLPSRMAEALDTRRSAAQRAADPA